MLLYLVYYGILYVKLRNVHKNTIECSVSVYATKDFK